jgi:hypothetical protein
MNNKNARKQRNVKKYLQHKSHLLYANPDRLERKKKEIESMFLSKGINYKKPGFYDDLNFVNAEKDDPGFLEFYAKYISLTTFSPEYIMIARTRIIEVADFIYKKQCEAGLKGVCLDASGVVSRFLERQGIWNYVAKGALTINFNKSTGISPTYIAPITLQGNPAVLGHAWIVAPPFKIVDISFSLQPYTRGEDKFLQGILAVETAESASVVPEDLFDQDAITQFIAFYKRTPTLRDIETLSPSLLSRIDKLGVFLVHRSPAHLKYVTCAISAPGASLEEIRNIQFSGKYPKDLYDDFLQQYPDYC